MVLIYSSDPYSNHILNLLNSKNVDTNKLRRLSANNKIINDRIKKNYGDIQIPSLIVKNADDKTDIISGSKLQTWIETIIESVGISDESMNDTIINPQSVHLSPPPPQRHLPPVYKPPINRLPDNSRPFAPPTPPPTPQRVGTVKKPDVMSDDEIAAAGVGGEDGNEKEENVSSIIDEDDDNEYELEYDPDGRPKLPAWSDEEIRDDPKKHQNLLDKYGKELKAYKERKRKNESKTIDPKSIIAQADAFEAQQKLKRKDNIRNTIKAGVGGKRSMR